MSRVRALDSTGDWTFGKGQNDYKTGLAAVRQNIQTRLSSFLGNCFFETTAGIDWFNFLGSKQVIALELAIRTTILNTENVTGLISVNSSLNEINRNLNIVYVVRAIPGQNIVITGTAIISTTDFLTTEDGNRLTTEDGNQIITEGSG